MGLGQRLVFITPAHGRLDITAICLEQRRRACDALAAHGIDATCVVIADDENLRTAHDLGFPTVRQANSPLGRKFNDGIRHACVELAATHIAPIGSDDWVLPDYLHPLPDAGTVISGTYLAVVSPTGDRIVGLGGPEGPGVHGYIPWIVPAKLAARNGYRPIAERKQRGIDGSLAASLDRMHSSPFVTRTHDRMQLVDFKSPDTQLTAFDLTVERNGVVWQSSSPWEWLATCYPADLCERMQRLYHDRKAVAA